MLSSLEIAKNPLDRPKMSKRVRVKMLVDFISSIHDVQTSESEIFHRANYAP